MHWNTDMLCATDLAYEVHVENGLSVTFLWLIKQLKGHSMKLTFTNVSMKETIAHQTGRD